MNIRDYGYDKDIYGAAEAPGIPARVTAAHRGRYEIVSDMGMGSARLKTGNFYAKDLNELPTTGDFVSLEWNPSGESRILSALKRRSFFERLDPSYSGKRGQIAAANFDYVFILQSLNRDFNVKRLERYLTLAWQSGAAPVVVLTKADLQGEHQEQLLEAECAAIGAEVYAVSAKTGQGLNKLNKYLLAGKTLVFLGSSGVGKSSLLNALAGAEIMPTAEIREDDCRGRHTTTHRELIMLPQGAMVIDTPGMRELGMWDVTDGLDMSFKDVEAYLGHCRFSDCTHTSEPGCAVLAAISSGELSGERFESYKRLKAEAKYSDDKENYLAKKEEKFKNIAKLNKNNKKR